MRSPRRPPTAFLLLALAAGGGLLGVACSQSQPETSTPTVESREALPSSAPRSDRSDGIAVGPSNAPAGGFRDVDVARSSEPPARIEPRSGIWDDLDRPAETLPASAPRDAEVDEVAGAGDATDAPPIPHDIEGMEKMCVACHAKGKNKAPKFPANHATYKNADCMKCHEPQ